MKLIIQGKNLEITEAIRDHVNQKIGKATNYLGDLVTKIDVELSGANALKGQPPQQIAEVTVYAKSNVIRAEERHENLYASIDLVSDKIVRQLKRYKERQQARSQHKATQSSNTGPDVATQAPIDLIPNDLIGERKPELPAKVLRNKFFAMPPMSVQEALDNLQLVDHDFYMFQNIATNEINVIYERNHGGYGVISPRKEASEE
jgi:putative sigma-54 modulation protein